MGLSPRDWANLQRHYRKQDADAATKAGNAELAKAIKQYGTAERAWEAGDEAAWSLLSRHEGTKNGNG